MAHLIYFQERRDESVAFERFRKFLHEFARENTLNGGNDPSDEDNSDDERDKMEQPSSASGFPDVSVGLKLPMEVGDVRKMLECPVCYDVILPPITLCSSGHAVCNSCKENLQSCPACRGRFTAIRNIFAENFLDKCEIKCKFHVGGCNVVLNGSKLAQHHISCNYRPVLCRVCDREIPGDQFLEHLRSIEKLQVQKAAECITGFEIDEEELLRSQLEYGENSEKPSVWEPTWIHCHGHDFFCILERFEAHWWIWVGALAPPEVCQTFVTSIMVWNKENQTDVTYVGTVHPIRSPAETVLNSGKCLIILDTALKNVVCKGGIDVLVRIHTDYEPPKTRKGAVVESLFTVLPKDSPGSGEPSGSRRANRMSPRIARNAWNGAYDEAGSTDDPDMA